VRKLLAATAVFAALTGNAASADIYTGMKLVNDCARGGNLGFCQGYILGVSFRVSCVPKGRDGVTADQLRFVVVQYIGSQPARWHMGAANLVEEALKDAYGC
jgi:Rap1a immunity proteins